jgi:hypothetical protein
LAKPGEMTETQIGTAGIKPGPTVAIIGGNMAIPNTMLIAISETASQIKGKHTDVKDMLRESMKIMSNHWLVTWEDQRFRAAVGAVMLLCTPEEKNTLEKEMKLLQGLSVATSGIPVDLTSLIEEDFVPIGALGIWKEVMRGK